MTEAEHIELQIRRLMQWEAERRNKSRYSEGYLNALQTVSDSIASGKWPWEQVN